MAFNFNWSPLIADTSRAREMLTTALNKSPKPPIIVDDIIVTELNLGEVPPDLEILEIGDLAEDKFRGIFKMTYTGDAYLTLRTRVQANPLNTYLSTKPAFTSPQPLAASSGLTIPLQITLSDIRLSGFVILVFSRQKGITVVFRNDPLESLKVSSTFDSIPFVRNYLQKEIEGQLRVLFMDDLPAIIHRLSLRVWSSEYQRQQIDAKTDVETSTETPINPLSSPPQNAFDAFGRPLEDADLSSLNADSDGQENISSFSQRNLLRLATLNDSHRTLSLFTPTIRDTIYRAWAGAAEKGEISNNIPFSASLGLQSRPQSNHSSAYGSSAAPSAYSFSDAGSLQSRSSRPTLSTLASTYSFGSGTGIGRSRGGARKRKHRVINLRKQEPTAPEAQPETTSTAESHNQESRPSTPTSTTGSSREAAPSSSSIREGELETPPDSPEKKSDTPGPAKITTKPALSENTAVHSPHPRTLPTSHTRLQNILHDSHSAKETPDSPSLSPLERNPSHPRTSNPSTPTVSGQQEEEVGPYGTIKALPRRPRHLVEKSRSHSQSSEKMPMLSSKRSVSSSSSVPPSHTTTSARGSILEQAWMMKMANEVARRVEVEKEARATNSKDMADSAKWKSDFWTSGPSAHAARRDSEEEEDVEGGEGAPPPAYVE